MYCVILYGFYINHSMELYLKTFTVPCEKSKTVSVAFSIIKNAVVFPALSKFAVKSIFLNTLGSGSKAYCLLKSIAIIL